MFSPINVRILKNCSKLSFRLFSVTKNLCSNSEDEVLFEIHNRTGLITLNRPKALNALNLNMVRTIHPVIKEWESNPLIEAIVMKGAGSKAFCAGGDVRAIAEGGPRCELSQVFFREEYRLNSEIGNLKTPFVALIDGITMGGGVGLSVHGKNRVASENTLFAMPETAIGFFPDVGGGYFLPRLKGKLGLFLALTGHRLKGRDVYFAGIATHYVTANEIPYLEEEVLKLNKPAGRIQEILNSYHKKCDDYNTNFSLSQHLETIDNTFSAPTLEEVFLRLQENKSNWSKKQLEVLKKLSPLSLKVTMKQIEKGAALSLNDVLKMEYRISQRFMEGRDFFEGIRSVLVDRDNSPKWQHKSLDEVSEDFVSSFFSPLPFDRELTI
ncbi:3-hydroxyisobutyryl-CoA hydrolase, mitochondrial isoform X3 [Hydra vulgaris]|uniref:3-hydroxyisobutyryl-CoA hydrolase, mitochondrial n=1 Tax=Hydra vulgaris TaxID=6087 RepID=A0ABM4CWQ0_HYDVU